MTDYALKAALIYASLSHSDKRYAIQKERISLIDHQLKTWQFDVKHFLRDEIPDDLESFDWVIAAGGDGTTLEVASYLRNTPVLPIRLFPESSVGFLCSIDADVFVLNRLNYKDFFTRDIPRLQCIVDDIPIETPILNEVLIAHPCPARASRYEITLNEQSEIQCSSGIWVATQPGSHGAAHAAGAEALDSSHLHEAVFCVRECSKPQKSSIKTKIFTPFCDTFLVKIISPELILFFDGGLTRYTVHQGQVISFRTHPTPLKHLAMRNAELNGIPE
ncbi:MAG: NAD(+)/NADH kinase [Proteobacteria bacterium]|nr:NAD(+)/NADH kinase [Pseudomonadota bacterium]